MDSRIILVLTALLSICSCNKIFPDDRNNYQPDEVIYMNIDQTRLNVNAADGQVLISIIKSGKGSTQADVTLAIDETFLSEYNAANQTSYLTVPSNIINEFTQQTLHFSESDLRQTLTISWNVEAISTYLKFAKYVIPLSITCSDHDIVEGKDKLLIYLTL